MTKSKLKKMEQDVIQYFLDFTSFKEGSKGYGLTQDHSLNDNKASIAGTGFMFSALVLACEYEMMDKVELKEKVLGTLSTLENVETFHGFFPHFLDMTTGQRLHLCEYSTIDTTLMLYGLLAIDQYINDKDIHRRVHKLLNQVDWTLFIDETGQYLRMAYNPDIKGHYVQGEPGFISQWDMFAEQLLMYVLLAGLIDDEELSLKVYKQFTRHQEKELIYPPHNTLFIYHMPLCFLDLRNLSDGNSVNWFDNAVLGTKSHVDTSFSLKEKYPTFAQGYFGMNASDTMNGYRVFGAMPNIENKVDTDGTISPYSMIGSLPYLSQDDTGIERLLQIPNLYQQYGFMDAFQIEKDATWVSNKYISIDKGIELLSFEQIQNDFIRNLIMAHPIVARGLQVLQFENTETNRKK